MGAGASTEVDPGAASGAGAHLGLEAALAAGPAERQANEGVDSDVEAEAGTRRGAAAPAPARTHSCARACACPRCRQRADTPSNTNARARARALPCYPKAARPLSRSSAPRGRAPKRFPMSTAARQTPVTCVRGRPRGKGRLLPRRGPRARMLPSRRATSCASCTCTATAVTVRGRTYTTAPAVPPCTLLLPLGSCSILPPTSSV